ncbi:uncharacterized protein MEPE_04726 [Melanopsichium pennsylvanicum]|uniref:Uncharacterized protein n=1 Tax=Melanopsichium pennsylvanicum TaxID=63383 RepID=A0AAJ4XPI6_9BASI|nr:uncharacterized protein MEPE_04726 [Melanopsichium pennsylvanicum]
MPFTGRQPGLSLSFSATFRIQPQLEHPSKTNISPQPYARIGFRGYCTRGQLLEDLEPRLWAVVSNQVLVLFGSQVVFRRITSRCICTVLVPRKSSILVHHRLSRRMEVLTSPTPSRIEAVELKSEKQIDSASTDSGSLTQRAALIRDELLGNGSLEQEPVQASRSSSASSEAKSDVAGEKETSDDDEALEDRLSRSSIAQALRHIAVSFDEKSCELESLRKIQQMHNDECALLKAQIEAKEHENQYLKTQLNETAHSYDERHREKEAFGHVIDHKNELLCVSDRTSTRLFDMLHSIKAQAEEAESLSPSIRSRSLTPSNSSQSNNSTSLFSSESTMMPPPGEFKVRADELIKEIQDKHSDQIALSIVN